MGFLPGASQMIEYGKNYDGYWTGEMFVNQVCCSQVVIIHKSVQLRDKIIPAFEAAHGHANGQQLTRPLSVCGECSCNFSHECQTWREAGKNA